MKKVQKTSIAELKREAVRWARTSGKPIAQVARELGISDTSIHQWYMFCDSTKAREDQSSGEELSLQWHKRLS